MRVVYLSAAAIPSRTANSIQVMRMCEAMAQEGHDVTLLAPKGWGWGEHIEIEESVWRHYGVEPSFSIHWLPAPGPRPSYPYGVVAAAYICLRSPRALVYARHLPGAVASALLRRRLVFEAHELPSSSGALGALMFSVLTRLRTLERVVVISHALRDAILARWPALATDDVVVAPDAVDVEVAGTLSPVEARMRLGIESGGGLTAGYVGQLYPGRGADMILKMAERLPDVSFLLVGGEPQDVSRFENTAREHELDNVTLTGFVAPADVPLYLAACDVLLMPYQRRVTVAGSGRDTVRWMSPLKMFEYLSAGRVVIASDLPVLREVLNDDIAVLADPEDIDTWCAAIRRVARDLQWGQDHSAAARLVAAQHTWRARTRRCIPLR